MIYDPEETGRREFISGLRRLAYFLERHRDIPTPRGIDAIVFPGGESDEARCGEVVRIAVVLGSAVSHDHEHSGHCRAQKDFGPVTYSVVAISATSRARHNALMSYADAIAPANDSADADGR
jgi:hypothetical protein